MESLIEMLPYGWCVDFTSFGSVGFEFNLYESGRNVLTAYDLDTFIKHSLIIISKHNITNI